ncbi:MAG: serine/threonine protein kinase [bacterium]|nr:serine/threonine protein kinase [bacterium]
MPGRSDNRQAELPPAEIADRYRVVSEVGRGGFGIVYRAFDRRLGRDIAIKRLSSPAEPDSELRARFEREARILASLDHPNIVPVFDAGLDDDHPYIAMKLIAGRSLSHTLQKGPRKEIEVLQIIRQVAAGLGHAHSRGIVHRDVKPSNILEDEDGRIFLADFGLSSGAFHPKITQRGAMIGTLGYMAPEALSGECTEKSDIYSLGAVLYEMIFGENCFTADDPRILFWKICSETPALISSPPPETSAQVLAMLRHLLDKDPAHRPDGIEEVRAEIELLLEPVADRGVSNATASLVRAGAVRSESPAKAILKLESDAEELSRLSQSSLPSLNRLLQPLTNFIFDASRLLERLRRAHDLGEEPTFHALTLSLLHLARDVERRVESLEPAEGEPDPLHGHLIHLQVRVLAPASELLAALEARAETPPAPDDFFAFEQHAGEAPLDDTEWIEDLLSNKSLRRHETALTVIGSGLQVFLRELSSRSANERDRLLEGLWQSTDVLLMEGRGRSRPVFESAISLATDPQLGQKWRTLYSLFQGSSGAYWDPILVNRMIEDQPKADRRVFGRALLVHPWEEYRRIALDTLKPPDFWVAIAHERLPLDWLLEVWRHLRHRVEVGDDYLKIFFACVKDRLEKPAEADRIVATVELVKELFQVDCFHETLFFKMLTRLEGHVRSEARRHGLLADFDTQYISQVREFRARPARPDQPVKGWGKVPLPVQRLLARRGHFQKHSPAIPSIPSLSSACRTCWSARTSAASSSSTASTRACWPRSPRKSASFRTSNPNTYWWPTRRHRRSSSPSTSVACAATVCASS